MSLLAMAELEHGPKNNASTNASFPAIGIAAPPAFNRDLVQELDSLAGTLAPKDFTILYVMLLDADFPGASHT